MNGSSRNVICYIGLGSNLGDPLRNCLAALDRLSSFRDIRLLRRSSFYRSEPVGLREQPWFVNAALEVRTALDPRELLKRLQAVEAGQGRVRTERWGPRTLDLDLLLYGQEVIREEGLCVPHPEMHKRRFVLVPLAEIASYVIHPAFGVSLQGLLGRLEDTSVVVPMDAAGEIPRVTPG